MDTFKYQMLTLLLLSLANLSTSQRTIEPLFDEPVAEAVTESASFVFRPRPNGPPSQGSAAGPLEAIPAVPGPPRLTAGDRKALLSPLQGLDLSQVELSPMQRLALLQEREFQVQGFEPFSPATDSTTGNQAPASPNPQSAFPARGTAPQSGFPARTPDLDSQPRFPTRAPAPQPGFPARTPAPQTGFPTRAPTPAPRPAFPTPTPAARPAIPEVPAPTPPPQRPLLQPTPAVPRQPPAVPRQPPVPRQQPLQRRPALTFEAEPAIPLPPMPTEQPRAQLSPRLPISNFLGEESNEVDIPTTPTAPIRLAPRRPVTPQQARQPTPAPPPPTPPPATQQPRRPEPTAFPRRPVPTTQPPTAPTPSPFSLSVQQEQDQSLLQNFQGFPQRQQQRFPQQQQQQQQPQNFQTGFEQSSQRFPPQQSQRFPPQQQPQQTPPQQQFQGQPQQQFQGQPQPQQQFSGQQQQQFQQNFGPTPMPQMPNFPQQQSVSGFGNLPGRPDTSLPGGRPETRNQFRGRQEPSGQVGTGFGQRQVPAFQQQQQQTPLPQSTGQLLQSAGGFNPDELLKNLAPKDQQLFLQQFSQLTVDQQVYAYNQFVSQPPEVQRFALNQFLELDTQVLAISLQAEINKLNGVPAPQQQTGVAQQPQQQFQGQQQPQQQFQGRQQQERPLSAGERRQLAMQQAQLDEIIALQNSLINPPTSSK